MFTYLTSGRSIALSVLWETSPSAPNAIITCHEVSVCSNADQFGGGGGMAKKVKEKKELRQLKLKLINGKLSG